MVDSELAIIALLIIIVLVLALATLAVNLLFPKVEKRE